MRSQGKPETAPLSAAEILNVVLDHVAEKAAESGESTEEDERWAQELHRKVHARIGELRRQVTPSGLPVKRVVPSAEIRALGRDDDG